jgi:hypothetical protein
VVKVLLVGPDALEAAVRVILGIVRSVVILPPTI